VTAAAWRTALGCVALGCSALAAGCAPRADLAPVTATVAPPEAETPEQAALQPRIVHLVGMASPMERRWVRPLGEQQLGAASYYGAEFNGRRMANGRRFDPRSTSVAHRTLPFGTKVLVTNRGNGRSTTATVEDRGPFVQGRIIDLSPRLAQHLGMIAQGVAPVEVTPVEVAEAPD
jgi:rare lipoprotein A